MISSIDGSVMSFGDGRFLLVADEDRKKVERILEQHSCDGVWTVGVSTVSPLSDHDNEVRGVAVWTLFINSYEDIRKIQGSLDMDA